MMVADFVSRPQNGSPINGEIPGQNHNNSNMPAHGALLMSSDSTGRESPASPDSDYNGNGYDLSGHLKRKDLFSQRKQREFIPDNKKDDSYWDRRRRNNEAAKRSREKRRFNDMVLEQRVVELTKENHVLKAQLDAIKNKYNICGENLVSVDQIMATLPTNEQVLSSTKRVKISSTPPIVFPLARPSMPPTPMTPQQGPPQISSLHTHQPLSQSNIIQQPQQHPPQQPPQQSQQAAVIHPNPNIESPPPPQSIASQLQQITIQHTSSHYSHHSPAAIYREYEPLTNGSSRCDSNKHESTIRSPLTSRVELMEHDEPRSEQLAVEHRGDRERERDRERHLDRADVPVLPVPTFGSSNSHISGPHISHHPYSSPYTIPNYPVSYAGSHLYPSPPREINALLTANVLNLSRRAPSPYETSNGTGSNSSHSSSGDDDHDREHIHDHNNSLPVKLRHKSHLGDKDAATALLALQNIKQEPQIRSSSPWDDGDGGSSDERDSGISTEWPTKAEQKMMVPLPSSPPSTSVSPIASTTGNIIGGKITSIPASVVISKKAEENIHLQSKLARLESEVATIKNMMISNTAGSGFGVTAAAQ